jgi:hypothetical protein
MNTHARTARESDALMLTKSAYEHVPKESAGIDYVGQQAS